MQHTRWEILQLLKRSGGNTVEELAHALSLAAMTVRQHLAILERDGHVASREIRKGPGRPSHLYSLGPQAEDLFPRHYDKLAVRLLREVADIPGAELIACSEQERVNLIMERMAERVAQEYAPEIHGVTLAERTQEVAGLLRDREGTLSEWAEDEQGFHIQDTNCPFQKIAAEEPALCDWHLHLLSRLIQADIRMERCIASGDSCCLYRIQPSPNSYGGGPETLGAVSEATRQRPTAG
ncbi:MAG: helix-turn-helix domain-containing protein [Chloroflexi bacterium]|nr:helix-turn-helix domain-containing protein [Chloroflexota bacterium]